MIGGVGRIRPHWHCVWFPKSHPLLFSSPDSFLGLYSILLCSLLSTFLLSDILASKNERMQHVSFCVWFILLNTLSSPDICRRHTFRAYWHLSNTITPHLRSGVSVSATVHEDICPLVDWAPMPPNLVQTSKKTRCTDRHLLLFGRETTWKDKKL